MRALTSAVLRTLAALGLATAGIASIIASSGGASFNGGGESPGGLLVITAGNAEETASAVVVAFGLSFDLVDAGSGQILPQPVAAAALASPGDLQLPDSPALPAMAAAVALQATLDPTTEPCDAGGQVTLSGTIADPGTLTPGDTITALFEDCDDNEGFVLDGQIELAVTDLQGDILADVFLLSLDAELVNLTVTDQIETISVDGDFRLTVDSLDFPVASATIAGSQLTLVSDGESGTLAGFDHFLEVDSTVEPDLKTARAVGSLDSGSLGGRVQYRTPVPVRATGDADPEEGEIVVTGAEDSSVTVVIVDGTSVRLDVDEDGDGVVDASIDTTWAALNGQTTT